jgi:hypothetical protein
MKLQLKGQVCSQSSINIFIDDVQIFSGPINQPPDKEITFDEFQCMDYGSEKIVKVSVNSGYVKLGSALLWVDDFLPQVPAFYAPRDYIRHAPGSDIDHRTEILINGAPPKWPDFSLDFMPGGTPENPDWNGWFFDLYTNDVATFKVVLPKQQSGERLPFCQGHGDDVKWYDADGNLLDSDPLGEDFWNSRYESMKKSQG